MSRIILLVGILSTIQLFSNDQSKSIHNTLFNKRKTKILFLILKSRVFYVSYLYQNWIVELRWQMNNDEIYSRSLRILVWTECPCPSGPRPGWGGGGSRRTSLLLRGSARYRGSHRTQTYHTLERPSAKEDINFSPPTHPQ